MQQNQYCQNKVCYYFDPPFLSALDKQKIKNISCLFCDVRNYCSESCRDQDWYKQHSMVCTGNPDNHHEENEEEIMENLENLDKSNSDTLSRQLQTDNRQLYLKFEQTDRQLEDYELLDQKIGQGTYGEVMLVKEKQTGKLFAMKIIAKGTIVEMTQWQLNREVNIQKKLNHQNILKLFYCFQDRDYLRMILEYAEKGPISHYIRNDHSEESIWRYFLEICLGINYLHTQNVIHRDLKPENILLTSDNTIKLCDFGWSAEVDNPMSKRDTICGTLDYMAPEIQKGCYGPQVDLWYNNNLYSGLLVLYFPYPNGEITELQFKNQTISPEAQDLIQCLLKVEPSERILLQDIFYHPWFVKMADLNDESLDKYQKEVSDSKLSQSQSLSIEYQFDIEEAKEFYYPEELERCSVISVNALDTYFNKIVVQQTSDFQVFTDLTKNLEIAEKNISKADELKRPTALQPRLSRISMRNQIIQKQNKEPKSFMNKLADVFTCISRDKRS